MKMKDTFLVISSLFLAQPLLGQLPDQHRWTDRVILLFAPEADHADYQRQSEELAKARAGVTDRDLVIYHLFRASGQAPDGQALSRERVQALRQAYRAPNGGFAFVLIGKDGGVKLREETVVSTKRLFGLIDRMPMRQAEMRRKKKEGGEP